MKKVITERGLCAMTLSAGAFGLLLRVWLFATGVDEKGLLRGSHPANIMIFLLTALVMAALVVCVLKCAKVMGKPFKASNTAAAGCIVAAIGILIANVLEMTQATDTVTMISSVVGVLAAVSFFYLGVRRKEGHRSSMAAYSVIILYYMTHLVVQYRMWSAEPQLQKYMFPLLASVFLMLCAYHRSALDIHGKQFRYYIFFNQAALFFCCLSLNTDSWLFYLAMAAWAATDLYIPLPKKRAMAARSTMELPENVRLCMTVLKDAGFSAYAVGGCVRDALLGKQPHDYDLCTNATPEQICQAFGRYQLVRNGEKHGTIGVVLDKEVYEITTFRTEGGYTDSRHPDWVEFVPNLEEDLARRDFTVNAMAYAPGRGYVDPWGGRRDLQERVLRTVGDPATRFREDPLRILRGVRFAVRYGLEPENETQKAMFNLAPLMDNLARERVFEELCKLLPLVTAKDMLRFAPVIVQVIPELKDTVDFQQHSVHHAYDVYTHTAHVVAAAAPTLPLRWAALLHDVAKPATFTQDEEGQGHFMGHGSQSAEMADAILRRLKAPTALRRQVTFLVEAHMLELEPDKKILRRRIGKFGEEAIRDLLQLQKADQAGKGIPSDAREHFEQVEALLEEIAREDACLSIKDLAINGLDLMEMGVTPGPQMGKILEDLLRKVQNEELPNEKEALLATAQQLTEK